MRISACFFKVACLAMVSLLFSLSVRGAEPEKLLLQEGKDEYTVGKRLYLYEDITGNQLLADILEIDSLFLPAEQEIPVFGSTRSAIWSRFTLVNSSKEELWYLKVGNAYLKDVTLFQQTASGKFTTVDVGWKDPLHNRALKTNGAIIPLELEKGNSVTFYLRVQSDFIVRFPITIASLPTLYEKTYHENLINGLYYGLMLALLVYNLFVFLHGNSTSLYYVLYIFFLGLNTAYIDSYTFVYLPEKAAWLNNTIIFAGLANLFAILFTNSFLQIGRQHKLLFSISLLLYGIAIVSLIMGLLDNTLLGFRLILAINALTIPYVFYAGFSSLKEGYKPAFYYLLGFGFLAVGVAVYALKDNAVLPANAFTENALKVGSAIEMIILSFALAKKFNLYKKEKEQLQEQALEQANLFSCQLMEKQENERKRIAAELHDSVGQSLILAKGKIMLLEKVQVDERFKKELEDVKAMLSSTVEEVRNISYALRPPQLDLLGLTQAIISMVEEVAYVSRIKFIVQCQEIDHLFSKEHEISIYRIIQECLNNIVKHSEATEAALRISRNRQEIEITIDDNGRGIYSPKESVEKKSGFGLSGIRERVNLLKGVSQINNNIPRGTTISIILPCREEEKDYQKRESPLEPAL